jgi:hypothetical protein
MEIVAGQKIGSLTLIGKVNKTGRSRWAYSCDCGNNGEINQNNIRKGMRQGKPYSCGCKQGNGSHKSARQNIIGQKFNRLTVLYFIPSKARAKVKCVCDCGNEIETSINHLRRNNTRSCGCWQKEQASISGCKNAKNALRNRRKWFHIKDGKKIRMRSCYEVMFAEILDRRGVDWKYEPKIIKLKNGMRYRPDFFVQSLNQWYEVKGYITGTAQEKIDEFRRQGNNLVVVLLDDIENGHPTSYRMFRKKWIGENG